MDGYSVSITLDEAREIIKKQENKVAIKLEKLKAYKPMLEYEAKLLEKL